MEKDTVKLIYFYQCSWSVLPYLDNVITIMSFFLISLYHAHDFLYLLSPFSSLFLSLLSDSTSLYGLFMMGTGKAHVFGIDTVRTNQMPNLSNLYRSDRTSR